MLMGLRLFSVMYGTQQGGWMTLLVNTFIITPLLSIPKEIHPSVTS